MDHPCGIWQRRRALPGPAPAVPGRHEPAGHGWSHRERSTRTGAHGPEGAALEALEALASKQLRPAPAAPCAAGRRRGRPGLERPPVRPAGPAPGAERPGCRSRSCTSSHDVRLLTRRFHVRRIARSTSACDADTQRPECVRNAPSEVFAERPSPANAPAAARSGTPGRT